MNNKERLTNLVKNYGVTKCRVDYVDFNNPRPSGRILVDVYNPNLLNEIYDIFTKDGYLDEDQNLLVLHNDFTEIEPNFSLDLNERELKCYMKAINGGDYMNNKEKFIKLLKSYGVTKCRVEHVDFNNPRPWGRILVDVFNDNLLNEIYDIFTADGYLDEDQDLIVYYNDFTKIEPNFSLD